MEPNYGRIIEVGDREMEAIRQVYEIVRHLNYGEQCRLVNWLGSRIETDQLRGGITTGPE